MNDIDEILEQGIMQLFPKISVNFPGITRRIIKTESPQCLISAGTAQYEDIKNLLLYMDHPPIIIHEEDRKEYYKGLEAWDEDQKLDVLIEFLKGQTVKTWKKQVDRT